MFSLSTSTPGHSLGLKLAPLKYEETIELGSKKTGFVDIHNPNDSTVEVTGRVQGFTQINREGDLSFFENEQLEQGIKIGEPRFTLAPREAARIAFTLDSNVLPPGGVYATILFTVSESSAEGVDSSGSQTSTTVGSLLILQNGTDGERNGSIIGADASFWQLGGEAVRATVAYENPEGEKSIAYRPELSVKVFPWGESQPLELDSSLVLPGITRDLGFSLDGDYFGPLPVTVTDSVSGTEQTVWLFAATGYWRFVAPLLLLAIASSAGLFWWWRNRR